MSLLMKSDLYLEMREKDPGEAEQGDHSEAQLIVLNQHSEKDSNWQKMLLRY